MISPLSQTCWHKTQEEYREYPESPTYLLGAAANPQRLKSRERNGCATGRNSSRDDFSKPDMPLETGIAQFCQGRKSGPFHRFCGSEFGERGPHGQLLRAVTPPVE